MIDSKIAWSQNLKKILLLSYPLFLLLCADVTTDVGPRDIIRPPDGLAALLPPARLSPARWVLQHLWDERSQLGLSTYRYRCYRDAASLSQTRPCAASGGVLIGHLWLGTEVPGNRNRLPKKSNVTMSVDRQIYGCGTRLMGQHGGGGCDPLVKGGSVRSTRDINYGYSYHTLSVCIHHLPVYISIHTLYARSISVY